MELQVFWGVVDTLVTLDTVPDLGAKEVVIVNGEWASAKAVKRCLNPPPPNSTVVGWGRRTAPRLSKAAQNATL